MAHPAVILILLSCLAIGLYGQEGQAQRYDRNSPLSLQLDSMIMVGYTMYNEGAHQEAYRHYREVYDLTASQEDPDPFYLLNAMIMTCVGYDIQFQADSAFKYAQICDSIQAVRMDAFEPRHISGSSRKLVFPFMEAGDLDRAKFHALQALAYAEKAEHPELILRAKERLTDLYNSTGEFNKAIGMLHELVEVRKNRLSDTAYDPLNERGQLSYLYDGIALNHASNGRPDLALPYFKRSLMLDDEEIHDYLSSKYGSLINVGTCYSDIGRDWDSVLYFFDIASRTNTDPVEREAYQIEVQVNPHKALALAHLGRKKEARELAENVLRSVPVSKDLHVDWPALPDAEKRLAMLQAIARTYSQIAKLEGSSTARDTALQLYQELRTGSELIMDNVDPLSMFSNAREMAENIDEQLDLIQESARDNKADLHLIATLLEQRRSLDLRRSQRYRHGQGIGTRNSYDLFRSLSHQRSLLTAEVLSDPSKAAILDSTNLALEELKRTLLVLPKEQEANLLGSLQRGLPLGTTVLAYAWTKEKLHVLVVTQDDAQFIPLGNIAEVNNDLETIINDIGSATTEADKQTSIALSRKLIPTTALPDLTEKLIIIPDGPLSQLPFEALITSKENGPPRYLLDDFDVRYEHCLSFIAKEANGSQNDLEVLACAPSFTGYAAASRSASNGPSWYRSGWGELRFNVEEANEILGHVKGRLLRNDQASKENLLAVMNDFRVIHLPTHAFSFDSIPELGGIVLQPAQGNGKNAKSANERSSEFGEADDVLYAYEIESMTIPAELVVLSACQTAAGKERKGEGVISLTRSFRSAGTKNVVSSLWRVDDAATKEIMVNFYQNLADGMGKAKALAEAKRTYRKRHPTAPASHWAAFVLFGDDESASLVKRGWTWWWWLAVGAVALTLALLIRLKWRKQ